MLLPPPRAQAGRHGGRRDPGEDRHARRRRQGLTLLRTGAALLALAGVAASATSCGGEPEAQAPVERESGEDEILRVGREWEARWVEKGFRTPPSRIALFEARVTSRLVFTRGAGTAEETLSIEESFKLSDGSMYECRSGAKVAVRARYGDHAGETAVELTRPPLRLTRACSAPGFPEPTISLDTPAARFALRGDRLVPLSPPKERREYLPAS